MTPFVLSRRLRGFTYIELLAVLCIVGILLAIFIPYVISVREQDRRVRCASNLRQIRDALQHYAADNPRHQYPRVIYDPIANRNGYTAFTGADAENPFAFAPAPAATAPSTRATVVAMPSPPLVMTGNVASVVQPSDVTASLWLLVRQGYVKDPRVFICPSTSDVADPLTDAMGRTVAVGRRSNFRSARNLSYSWASPFSGYDDYLFTSDSFPGRFALMADRNPGGSAAAVAHDASPMALAAANSPNHGRAGQNVLYADSSVAFETTPYCGVGRDPDKHQDGDNIYTALASAPLPPGTSPFHADKGYSGRQYGPSYQYDSYLVPMTGDDTPHR